MCLGVPGKVTEWLDRDPVLARGWIEFDGLRKECSLACVPEVEVGDYVIVHAGIAICQIDAEHAAELLATLRNVEENYLAELEDAP